MKILYDILIILPFSLLATVLFGSYAGMPEDSAAGFVICLALSLTVISLRGMKRKNRFRGICAAAVFIIVLMIAAGEKAGRLEDMLDSVADSYDEEVEAMLTTLTALMEPFLMVFLGVIIGTIVLAMFLPIFNMGSLAT